MARLTIGEGLDTYIGDLEKLAGPALEEDMRRTIYKGAAVVMDAVKDEAEKLPTYGGYRRGTESNKIDGVSKAQKSGILKSLGIAKMRYDGAFLNAKIGADGYNSIKTKRWPNGQPNAMIIRSLESGTSFMKKIPFVTRAVRKVQERAEKAMADEYDKQIKKRLGGI